MMADPFGNLMEWDHALAELRRHTERETLDGVQPGLVRLIRYPHNWQLNEQALLAVRQVRRPTPALLEAILRLAMDADGYLDARILALRALGELVPRRQSAAVPDEFEPEAMIERLRQLLAVPEAPVFHRAVEKAVARLQRSLMPVPA